MTTPSERTRAVVHTAEFLRDLTMPSVTPEVPRAVREEARRLLRHYPGRGDMSLVHEVMPQWFGELPDAPPYPGATGRSGHPTGLSSTQGDSQEVAVEAVVQRRAELLPTVLRELGGITPPESVARAELVARLEKLRLQFASPAVSEDS